MKGCALILGGHINGYSIVKELSQDKEVDILLMDYGHSIAKYSNKIKKIYYPLYIYFTVICKFTTAGSTYKGTYKILFCKFPRQWTLIDRKATYIHACYRLPSWWLPSGPERRVLLTYSKNVFFFTHKNAVKLEYNYNWHPNKSAF